MRFKPNIQLRFAAAAVLGALVQSSSGWAEYRAFRLSITDPLNGTSRFVTSTLDHQQYGRYQYVRPTELIKIDATWMCYGRSEDFKPICPAPEKSPDRREPANIPARPMLK